MTVCANHSETNAIARCTRCRSAFCDGCIVFLVNDDPWCEPCGNGEIDSGKGSPILAVVALLVLLALFAAFMFVQLYVVRRFYFVTAALVFVPFGVAWRIAYPPTTGDKPVIVDRTATALRPPVPLEKRLL